MNLGNTKVDVRRAAAEGPNVGGLSMSKNGTILIAFAWVMEIVGVGCGLVNSTYTTFGEELPNTVWGYVPAVPMLALTVAELGRVPLASALYHKHKLIQGVTILGIIALGYLAVENWTFGFERIVDLRLKNVNAATAESARADAELSGLVERRNQMTTNNIQKRDELRRGIDQRDGSIADLTAQLTKEAEAHQKNLVEIRDACRLIRGECIVPRSRAEDGRYAAEVTRLGAERATLLEDRKRLQLQIDQMVKADATDVTGLDEEIALAARTATEARKMLRRAADGNQIYRLAAGWYGVSTSDVTEEQFATARWVFSTFSAVAVALAGSIAALVYYARSRVPGTPSFVGELVVKLVNARRAYFARKRKPLKIEVPGPERVIYRDGKEPPILIEKTVDRFIDHIVLIPRWGIWSPTYINSLIRFAKRNLVGDTQIADPADSTSNVTQLKKRVN
jgi:hypothetical protein